MGLIYNILEELSKTTLRYKGVSTNLFGIPKFKDYSKGSLRGTLFYMYKNGFVDEQNDFLRITPKGRKYIERKIDSLKQFSNKFDKEAPKNLLLMYDIPEEKKAEREWFRWHLKKFGFVMIQKSVWVGPSPLPRDFLDYIKRIKIKDNIQTFKLAKGFETRKR
ncbi:CRISPR-associated endonuclease Cas2 [Candidatus Nomurabacteria bacterium RIFCSPLOWO2_01_FULL_41_21]|uniref:CRISPR-associated endonuclease Cas2 n=2 Tax=Candidatus Nomuraibacteriota TaxID=1752729 RepID=A0A1F6V2I4_9BACT|nr:MAG: CRISPR-associated endonuclease Cas2 [Candidatus Nomurabacteria bacterium RIFCSPHIGHO2_01_FULL_40_20]OGI87913.1 MAG: CRISPR-associated endonuclease Cas2 [Candidatus Nomurabacteria bacterium RIFCSPLOWO2_01_FULL_41_21]